ncbi:MAG: cobalamin-binding protein [Candidatus Bathyarchaeota archaeon]
MSKKIIVFVLALIIVVGVAGVIVLPQFFKPEEAVAGPISVIDDVGRNVTITGYPPERIVSLAPSCTEILFALGLGDKVVGVDEFSDYPLEVQERVEAGNLTTVGSFSEISMELVVGLEPDLILATGGVQRVVVESLEGLDQTVVVLYPERFDGVLADISLVGEATGQIDEAEALVADMQERAQEIADKTQGALRPRVYVEYYFNGGYWSFASGSYVDELIYMAGGVNVFSEVAGGHISTSTEEVLVQNPEIIIIGKGTMATACGLTPETIKERPSWSEISAVQNDQIYEIDEPILALPIPRLIEGLEELAKVIHPELFMDT